jgi:hypothetical protein
MAFDKRRTIGAQGLSVKRIFAWTRLNGKDGKSSWRDKKARRLRAGRRKCKFDFSCFPAFLILIWHLSFSARGASGHVPFLDGP